MNFIRKHKVDIAIIVSVAIFLVALVLVLKDERKEETNYLSGKYNAVMEIENYGTIKLELDADVAPITVTNFVRLADAGFYDGLTIHRVQADFVIQGGDPDGDGTGGSGQTIKGEFKSNGVENSISHKRGVISMARSNNPDSASSQFFIMHKDNTGLDGSYAAFGHVTEGMEVVDAICEEVPAEDSMGSVLPENQPVIKSVKVEKAK